MTNAPTPRKKSEKRQRGTPKAIRFTSDEFNAAAAKAEKAGLSFGAYVRAAAIGDEGPRAKTRLPVDAQLVRLALAQLAKYGNNMNQIAHQLNAHGETALAAEFGHALTEWTEIRDAMLNMLRKSTQPATPGGPRPE